MNTKPKLAKCLVCGKEIEPNLGFIPTSNGPICSGCEGASIEAWHVAEENGDGYYELTALAITDMLSEMNEGDCYIIRKVSIEAVKYRNLPEFQGF